VAVSERTLSEFLQHSGRVLPELAAGEVVLHRRDGEDLVLMTRRQREALNTMLRTFVAAASDDLTAASATLWWLRLLDPEDQQACLRELRQTTIVALATGQIEQLADALHGWEATALAVWDERRSRERGGYDEWDPVVVPRPES
jgi:hypothetical protein